MIAMPLPSRSARQRAFTIIELLATLMILAILLTATQSAMMLAGKAVPNGNGVIASQIRTSRALDTIAADLQYATSITTATATDLQFVVPDRNGDGSAETIRYTWSGTAGDPLTRTYNAGSAVTILSNVQEFQLVYDKRSKALPTSYSESAETLLASYDTVLDLDDWSVSDNNWIGQYFQPILPANTTSWKITRVKFQASHTLKSNGQTYVQICYSSAGLPVSAVLDQVTLLENTLPGSASWQQCSFSNASGIPPSTGLCLVFQCAANSPSCNIQYQTLGALANGAYLVTTTDGGSSWSGLPTQAMPYYVYGTITTPDSVVYQYTLTDVRASLRAGSDSLARATTSIRVFNEPQVAGP
jgi:prepilin-type N-terminal cleavage/methylation domain-containing protein